MIKLLLIIAVIYISGVISQFIYILVTPSNIISTEDCKRKNLLYKLLKFKK